jgi:hypothetical protein
MAGETSKRSNAFGEAKSQAWNGKQRSQGQLGVDARSQGSLNMSPFGQSCPCGTDAWQTFDKAKSDCGQDPAGESCSPDRTLLVLRGVGLAAGAISD